MDRHETHEQHLDIALDDEPAATREPVYVDVVAKVHDRQPIVPAGWRGLDNIKASLRFQRDLLGYRAGYHGTRLVTRYLWLGLFWAVVGVFRLAGRQIRWWWVIEAVMLAQSAATKDNWYDFRAATDKGRQIRLFRGLVLLAEVVGLAAAVVILAYQPAWIQGLVIVLAVPPLAHIGRPVDRRIISPAVVTPRFRRINPDMVVFAYQSAKLTDEGKPGYELKFLSTMRADKNNLGSSVHLALPPGKTFPDAIKNRGEIASGLDVSVNQVFLTRDRASERSHFLYVANRDPLAIPAGRTPLLRLKQTDIWKPAPLGPDERGNPVSLLLLWISVLIGAQPRKGKTFAGRLLALYAALDPYVQLVVVDGKNSPDWRSFGLVAHRMIYGTVPNRTGNPVEQLIEALHEIKGHIDEVNAFLSTLPLSECPEGKLTRELSHKYPQLRVWLLVLEEFQVYYELDDKDASEEIASLLSYIMAVGPSAGVTLISLSQKPSGIGASQNIQRLFTRYRDNHTVRLALKCGSRQVSEAVLGTEAYGEGFDATTLPVGEEYRGVGILYGASDNTPVVRTHLADGQDAEKILIHARRLREQLGLLTGEAAGEEMEREARDVLADVIRVFSYAGKTKLHWEQLAELMANQMPETYAGVTADAISKQVRSEGVAGGSVRDGVSVKQGVKRDDVQAAIDARAISA